jgi:Rieske Fe-S protein
MIDSGMRDASRRRVLRAFVNATLALLGAGMAAVVGRFAVVPRAASRADWFRAASLLDLDPQVPYPAVVAVPRRDGWARVRANETVFIVWDGLTGIRALSATCTHLGCRVRWDGGSNRFKCPCHGGEYGADGAVTGGPPPRPLHVLQARISDQGDVEVRI